MQWMKVAALGFAVLAAGGCGGDGLKRVPVAGKVTAKGAVVGGATVSFMPLAGTLGEGGIGTTDAAGNYTLIGSREGAEGVVPGKYKVRVNRLMDLDGTALPLEAKQADYPHAEESVPEPFSSPEPPLQVTVPEEGGTINVEIPVEMLGKK